MLNSCIKKEDFNFNKLAGFEYAPNVAAPIVNTTLHLSNILNDYNQNNLITIDPVTGFLTLNYDKTVYSKTAAEIIVIPLQPINTSLSFPYGAIAFGDSAIYPGSVVYPFVTDTTTVGAVRFDSIIIKSGYLQFNINILPSVNNAKIYFSLPNATKNGIPFRRILKTPFMPNDTFHLNGYKLKFAPGTPYNQFPINDTIIIYGPQNANTYTVSLGESIDSLKFSKIFGYFGHQTFPVNEDSVLISVFKNKVSDSLFFEDPKLFLNFQNAIGMPISISTNLLQALPNGSPAFNITGSGVPTVANPWVIAAPTWSHYVSVATSDSLTAANSTIQSAIALSPKYMNFQANAITNPNGNIATTQNFVLDTSRFSVDMHVKLPLYGMGYYAMQDTVSFSFGSTSVSQLQWVNFVINTTNGFPLGATMQIYFADSLHRKIDSLLTQATQQVLLPASVGPPPAYMVTSPSTKMLQIKVTQSFLQHVSNVKYLLIYAKLRTTNTNGTTLVKFYSSDFIKVKLGVQAQAQTIVYPNHH